MRIFCCGKAVTGFKILTWIQKLMITKCNHDTCRYWRGCCLQGPGQEQVVISISKENHLHNHQSLSSHDDENHYNHRHLLHNCDVGDGERMTSLWRNMFVQIFEHVLHGTNIQMELRNDSWNIWTNIGTNIWKKQKSICSNCISTLSRFQQRTYTICTSRVKSLLPL